MTFATAITLVGFFVAFFALTWALAYHRANGIAWTVGLSLFTLAVMAVDAPTWLVGVMWVAIIAFAALGLGRKAARSSDGSNFCGAEGSQTSYLPCCSSAPTTAAPVARRTAMAASPALAAGWSA